MANPVKAVHSGSFIVTELDTPISLLRLPYKSKTYKHIIMEIKLKVIPFYSNLSPFFLNYFDKENRAYLCSNFPCQISNFRLEINWLPVQGFCQSRATVISQKLLIPLVFQFYGVMQSLYSYISEETRKLQSGYFAINSSLLSTSYLQVPLGWRQKYSEWIPLFNSLPRASSSGPTHLTPRATWFHPTSL